ncbi:LysR family transcriptional regulator [Duganella sp. FT94W]|uniref:LysR family transcriptional regulator n=1 Tax=Duganella lactea TaxID=2692173 RepID=A0ABW9V7Z4_9BURK|nr:LysR family transcriptional regulator [Duganella lactea]MYM35758.1 LysR family transcriptional regulator [Duganella lactea]
MFPITDSIPTTESALKYGQIPLRGADLPLLVSLDVLLQECNVTRAAARLSLSQPALSAQLARLRQLFDDPLLIAPSNGRGLVASQFALNLHRRLKPALAVLSSAIQINADDFHPTKDARCFTIAATPAAAAMIIPTLIGNSAAFDNPGMKFVTVEPDFPKLASQMEKGEIDICLSPACMLPPDLCVSDLMTVPHVVVQRRRHPGGTGPVTLDEYGSELTHVNVAHNSSLHGYIDEQLYRQGRSRQVQVAVRDFSCVPAILKRSDLICTVPAAMINPLDLQLEWRALAFPFSTYSLCLAWHPRCEDDPSFLWLRGELINVAAMSNLGHGVPE